MPGLLSLSSLLPDGFHVESAEVLETGIAKAKCAVVAELR